MPDVRGVIESFPSHGRALTRNQVRGFWASWTGLALDGMDSFLYALVLVPALRDLLPRSGLEADQSTVGLYGSILFAMFLIGWGLSFLWGPIADRIGRVRTMVLTILCFSIFTLLGCIATNVWELGFFRLVAGAGIGGEWTVGAVFVAEEWPEALRKKGAGFVHTGYYFGFFMASLINFAIGAHHSWRWVFVAGGLPALLVTFVRYGVSESDRWEAARSRTIRSPFFKLFSAEYRSRTMVMTLLVFISMVGLWAGSVYAPSAVTYKALSAGYNAVKAARITSFASALLAIGTILGCFMTPFLAERLGRRKTLAFYFVIMFVCIAGGFGYLYYQSSVVAYIICMFFLGIGGANFSVYTLWVPEQFPTECRGSAFAFSSSFGRFFAAGITFIVGAGVNHLHTIGKPVAYTAIGFLIGLLIIPLSVETLGEKLPQ
jgi:MFS family permease